MEGRIHVLWRFFLPVSVLSGCLKCPVCSFVYGTKWEFNRHLKNKHGLKLVENEGDPKWEVLFKAWYRLWLFLNADDKPGKPSAVPQSSGSSGWETWKSFQTLSHIWGVPLGESQAMHVTSCSGLRLGWFVNVRVGLIGIFHFCYHEFRASEVASERRMHDRACTVSPPPEDREGPHLLILGPPLLPPEACPPTCHLCFPLRCWNQFPDWII